MTLRFCLAVALGALSGCTDCADQLQARAQTIESVQWPSWDVVGPSPHLVLRTHGLVWDAATDAYHEAQLSGRCPEPLPAPSRTVGRFDGDTFERTGLYVLLREQPGLRIEPAVPFERVQVVLEAYRQAGMGAIDLRHIRCAGTCRPEQLRVGLALDRDALLELDPQHVRPHFEQLDLTVVETATGWVVRGSGGRMGPGCELITTEDVDTIRVEEGVDALATCLRKIKDEFEDEWVVAMIPRDDTPWVELVSRVARIQHDERGELFPLVVFPGAGLDWPRWPTPEPPPPPHEVLGEVRISPGSI